MDRWVYPLHFIDFEIASFASPLNAGRRPYETMAFEFFHHVAYDDGMDEHYGEYLDAEQESFPNCQF